MWQFAWRNLLTRPLRTILALIGLSVPILGVVGLFSVSSGLRNLVGETLGQIQGVMVLRENVPSPVFSDLPAAMERDLRKIPGVYAVAPEVWKIAPPIEGQSLFFKRLADIGSKDKPAPSLLETIVIQGQDIPAHQSIRSAVYPKKLLPPDQGGGRFLTLADQGSNNIVISKKIAEDYPVKDGGKDRPRRVGDTLRVGSTIFNIIGIYDAKSMFLDVTIVMDIATARKLLEISDEQVSSFYVEATDPAANDRMTDLIESAAPGVDARSMQEFIANFAVLMTELDKFLLMTVSLALLVGVVGIINTMLMSTTERFVEFGVLRTNGWSKSNVLTLVTAESAYLGLLAGLCGCLLAVLGVVAVNPFLGGGLSLTVSPREFVLGLSLSVIMGILGGIYPAWRASKLVPMDAIRLGSH